jgi:transposase
VPADTSAASRGLTTRDVAQRYRVGEDRVRSWIKAGLLKAINTADVACGKPRFVVPPEALVEFERTRAAAAPPKATRSKRRPQQIDYFAD